MSSSLPSQSNQPVILGCIVNPSSSFLIVWNSTICLSALMQTLLIYWIIIQQKEFKSPLNLVLDSLINFLFLVDMIINFRTAFYNEVGDLNTQAKAMLRRYLTSIHFYLDFLTSIPFLYIFWSFSNLQILQLIKVIRLKKCSIVIKSLNLTTRIRKILQVLVYILFLTIAVLSTACIWLSLSLHSHKWLPLIYQLNHGDSSQFLSLQDHSTAEQFFLSLVYSNIMIISEGEAFPSDLGQFILASITLFLGSFIDAILFGFMIQNVLQANSRRREADQLYCYQMQMTSSLNLSKQKRAYLVQFLHSSSISQMYLQELKDFLNYLSPTLKQIVVRDITKEALTNCVIYKNLIYSNSIAQDLQLQLKLPQDIIFDYNSQGEGVYFLIRGKVELFRPRISKPGFKSKKILSEGSYFGQIALILNTTRTMRAQCSGLSYTTLGLLNSKVIKRELWNNAKAKFIVTRGITKYKDSLNKRLENKLRKSKVFNTNFLLYFKNQLFKFRIKHYVAGSFIWTPGQLAKGFGVLLKGHVSCLVKINNVLVPVYCSSGHDVIGFQHSLIESPHQTYLRADKFVTIAFYSTTDLKQFRKQNGIADRILLEEIEQIEESILRPKAIDLLTKKQRNSSILNLKFKNTVIVLMKKLRQNKHKTFLENLKNQKHLLQHEERREIMRKQFVTNSLLNSRPKQNKQFQRKSTIVQGFYCDQILLRCKCKQEVGKIHRTLAYLGKKSTALRNLDRCLISLTKQVHYMKNFRDQQHQQESIASDSPRHFSLAFMDQGSLSYSRNSTRVYNISECYLPSESESFMTSPASRKDSSLLHSFTQSRF